MFTCTEDDMFNLQYPPDLDEPCCICEGPSTRNVYGTSVCETCYQENKPPDPSPPRINFDLMCPECGEVFGHKLWCGQE